MLAGSVIGSLFGRAPAFAGGLIATTAGVFAATIFAERKAMIRASAWNGVVRLSLCGLFLGIIVSDAIGLAEPILYFGGIPGAGLGAMLGNYLDHFFDYERPPKLF